MINPYLALELDSNATLEKIKLAYRELALRHHPDRNNGKHSERFLQVQQAYDVLNDPHKKKLYDRYGAIEEIDEETLHESLKKFSEELEEDLEALRDKNLSKASKKGGFNIRECSDCCGTGIVTREVGFFIQKEKCPICKGEGFIEHIEHKEKYNDTYAYQKGMFRWW